MKLGNLGRAAAVAAVTLVAIPLGAGGAQACWGWPAPTRYLCSASWEQGVRQNAYVAYFIVAEQNKTPTSPEGMRAYIEWATNETKVHFGCVTSTPPGGGS